MRLVAESETGAHLLFAPFQVGVRVGVGVTARARARVRAGP